MRLTISRLVWAVNTRDIRGVAKTLLNGWAGRRYLWPGPCIWGATESMAKPLLSDPSDRISTGSDCPMLRAPRTRHLHYWMAISAWFLCDPKIEKRVFGGGQVGMQRYLSFAGRGAQSCLRLKPSDLIDDDGQFDPCQSLSCLLTRDSFPRPSPLGRRPGHWTITICKDIDIEGKIRCDTQTYWSPDAHWNMPSTAAPETSSLPS